MRVDTMRSLDYWLGIPLTFVASLWVWLQDQWRGKQTPPQVKRVLFVELSEMGSTILADPAMRRAKERLDAELYFVIFAKNRPSLELLNTIPRANVFTLREDSLFTLMIDFTRYLVWCRRQQIDTVIDLELFSRISALMTGLSGAWRRVGFHAFHNEGLWRGFMLTHRVSYNPHQHIAKNFIALIHSLESPTAEVPFAKIPISDADVRLAQRQFSHEELVPIRAQVALCVAPFDPSQYRLVLINPNASELLPQRRWAKERYAQLIQALLEAHPDILILITGAPNERAEAEQLRLSCQHSRVINFAGSVTFAQLPALYTISCLMVTNDSGPGHFSAITPLKTFVLFGPETPALYGSLGNSTPIWAGLSCAPCVSASNHRKTPCQQPACMDAIRVDQVKTLVSAYLTETTATE